SSCRTLGVIVQHCESTNGPARAFQRRVLRPSTSVCRQGRRALRLAADRNRGQPHEYLCTVCYWSPTRHRESRVARVPVSPSYSTRSCCVDSRTSSRCACCRGERIG